MRSFLAARALLLFVVTARAQHRPVKFAEMERSVEADLRLLDSSEQRVNTNTGTTPVTVTVRGTLIEQLPALQSNGGGLNTSMTLVNQNLSNVNTVSMEGLASRVAGVCQTNQVCSVNVQFKLGVEREGAFRFVVSLEGLP